MTDRVKQLFKPDFRFGLGGVSLGNEFNKHTDKDAEATLQAAWAVGVRYFTCAVVRVWAFGAPLRSLSAQPEARRLSALFQGRKAVQGFEEQLEGAQKARADSMVTTSCQNSFSV